MRELHSIFIVSAAWKNRLIFWYALKLLQARSFLEAIKISSFRMKKSQERVTLDKCKKSNYHFR